MKCAKINNTTLQFSARNVG